MKRAVVLMAGAVASVLFAGCGGQARSRHATASARKPEPAAITPQIAACQRAGKLVCNPRGRIDNFPLARPDPAGAHLLTGEEALSRFAGLAHLRSGETVTAARMTYAQLHAVNPALASATRLLVNPTRLIWAITWHFSPPIRYQPCRYESCPAAGTHRTILLSASSEIIDALTGKTTDYCTGCSAIPARGPVGTLSGKLAICCSASGSSPVPGVVAVRQIGGGSTVIGVHHSGRFSLQLPVGRYQAVGGIPEFGWRLGQCHPDRPTSSSPPATPIDVALKTTTRTWIVCAGQ